MNSINLPIEVKVETRQLRSKWTVEMISDLSIQHGLDLDDLEKEIYKGLRREKRKSKVEKLFH